MGKTTEKSKPEYIEGSLCLYTDGSAITHLVNVKRYGGWSLYITDHKDEHIGFHGGAENTTISRMEQEAMNRALEFLIKRVNSGENRPIHIYSDSQFVVNSINKGWLSNWNREKFIARANADIWKRVWGNLEKLRLMKSVYTIHHIRGHQKDLTKPHVFGNNVADVLADYKQFL
tara:strand:+ start:987 stop:1508 length:522 start_codon:yes stop_codon:yes gene_type:complete